MIKRRYLLTTDSSIKFFIKCFVVPKGEDDIRLVYNVTANKLNKCVCVPSFWLPMIDSLVCVCDVDTWMTDCDIENMFLNFQLHAGVVPFTGNDLSSLYDNPDESGPRWAMWDRNLMGFAASPYNSIKMAMVAEEIFKEVQLETGVGVDGKELNPFQRNHVHLNLPGTKGCDPCSTWNSKRREDRRIACDVFTFIDDARILGSDEELAWQASHTFADKQSTWACKMPEGRYAHATRHVTHGWGP